MQALGETLGFEVVDLFVDDDVVEERTPAHAAVEKRFNIAVAGTGYVGYSTCENCDGDGWVYKVERRY